MYFEVDLHPVLITHFPGSWLHAGNHLLIALDVFICLTVLFSSKQKTGYRWRWEDVDRNSSGCRLVFLFHSNIKSNIWITFTCGSQTICGYMKSEEGPASPGMIFAPLWIGKKLKLRMLITDVTNCVHPIINNPELRGGIVVDSKSTDTMT